MQPRTTRLCLSLRVLLVLVLRFSIRVADAFFIAVRPAAAAVASSSPTTSSIITHRSQQHSQNKNNNNKNNAAPAGADDLPPNSLSLSQEEEDSNDNDNNHNPMMDYDDYSSAAALDLSTTRQLLSHFETMEIITRLSQKEGGATATTTTTTTTSPASWWTILLTTAGGVLAGTYAMSCVFSDLLSHWEWMQAWRYTWPFGIGALYMSLNIISSPLLLTEENSTSKAFSPSTIMAAVYECMVGESLASRLLVAVFGLGLIIGGAYDVWMPVYMTGPNVVTAAGIGQDAAVGLFGWSFWKIMRSPSRIDAISRSSSSSSSSSMFILNNQRFLQVLLLAELYKLGEGAFDELLFSKLVTVVS